MQVIPSQFYSEGWAEQENAELNMASALEADPGCCQQHTLHYVAELHKCRLCKRLPLT